MATNMDSRKLSLMHRYLMDRYYGGGADSPIEIPRQYASEAEAMMYADPDAASALNLEPYANQTGSMLANREYDAGQPYGFDFSDDANLASPGGRYSTVHPDGYVSTDVAQAGDLNAFKSGAADKLLPIVRMAGSYALPILFSMLMRGGK